MGILYRNTYREGKKERIVRYKKEFVYIGYMVDGCVHIVFTRLRGI